MALGTIAAAVAGGAASAGASALIGGMFGPKAPKSAKNAGITNFNAGGLSGRFDRKTSSYDITSNAARDELVTRVSRTFGDQANAIRGLRDRVAPGFSDLRKARLGEIENARGAAIGNLRENLSRRRVMGSSFAADALARAELQFAQERDRVQSETFLQELAATNELLTAEFEAGRNEYATKISEMNLQAELAATLTSKASANLNAMAQLEARLAAESASGFGKFVGDAVAPVGKAVTNEVGAWLNGGAT